MDTKNRVQEQFGANASDYLDSRVHAKGASLERLVTLTQPQPDWHVLDVASAAGHTAFAFAPHVDRVVATDITDEMLQMASDQVEQRNFDNVTVEYAEAEAMPFEDGRFDLVTCRIAPHHFEQIDRFVAESYRVLKEGGLLAVVDNVVPPGPAGDYINAVEKLRDPSHVACLSIEKWAAIFGEAGFTLKESELLGKEMSFAFWAKRHDERMRAYLRALFTEAGGEARSFFRAREQQGDLLFDLREGILIGRKA